MPTTSTVMGFDLRSSADPFSHTALWTQNFSQILDSNPGTFLCLSTSRPSTWGANQNGRRIYELDTGLTWIWNGTQFVRSSGQGLLSHQIRTSPISSSSTAYATAVSVTALTVPAGNRALLVLGFIPKRTNTAVNGEIKLALFRDATQLQAVEVISGPTDPAYSFIYAEDVPGAGAHSFSLQFACDPVTGGTSTLTGAANQAISLDVIEI